MRLDFTTLSHPGRKLLLSIAQQRTAAGSPFWPAVLRGLAGGALDLPPAERPADRDDAIRNLVGFRNVLAQRTRKPQYAAVAAAYRADAATVNEWATELAEGRDDLLDAGKVPGWALEEGDDRDDEWMR